MTEEKLKQLLDPQNRLEACVRQLGVPAALQILEAALKKQSRWDRKEQELQRAASRHHEPLDWDDARICRDVFGKKDTSAADPNALVAVRPPAIRIRLQNIYGRKRGLALFHAGTRFGVTVHLALRLRDHTSKYRDNEEGFLSYLAKNWCHGRSDVKPRKVRSFLVEELRRPTNSRRSRKSLLD